MYDPLVIRHKKIHNQHSVSQEKLKMYITTQF